MLDIIAVGLVRVHQLGDCIAHIVLAARRVRREAGRSGRVVGVVDEDIGVGLGDPGDAGAVVGLGLVERAARLPGGGHRRALDQAVDRSAVPIGNTAGAVAIVGILLALVTTIVLTGPVDRIVDHADQGRVVGGRRRTPHLDAGEARRPVGRAHPPVHMVGARIIHHPVVDVGVDLRLIAGGRLSQRLDVGGAGQVDDRDAACIQRKDCAVRLQNLVDLVRHNAVVVLGNAIARAPRALGPRGDLGGPEGGERSGRRVRRAACAEEQRLQVRADRLDRRISALGLGVRSQNLIVRRGRRRSGGGLRVLRGGGCRRCGGGCRSGGGGLVGCRGLLRGRLGLVGRVPGGVGRILGGVGLGGGGLNCGGGRGGR